jgi:hypothetical protein
MSCPACPVLLPLEDSVHRRIASHVPRLSDVSSSDHRLNVRRVLSACFPLLLRGRPLSEVCRAGRSALLGQLDLPALSDSVDVREFVSACVKYGWRKYGESYPLDHSAAVQLQLHPPPSAASAASASASAASALNDIPSCLRPPSPLLESRILDAHLLQPESVAMYVVWDCGDSMQKTHARALLRVLLSGSSSSSGKSAACDRWRQRLRSADHDALISAYCDSLYACCLRVACPSSVPPPPPPSFIVALRAVRALLPVSEFCRVSCLPSPVDLDPASASSVRSESLRALLHPCLRSAYPLLADLPGILDPFELLGSPTWLPGDFVTSWCSYNRAVGLPSDIGDVDVRSLRASGDLVKKHTNVGSRLRFADAGSSAWLSSFVSEQRRLAARSSSM